MPNILQAKSKMASLALARNGQDITVRGIPFRAVFFDGEIETEAGFVRQTSLSFNETDLVRLRLGDSIFVNKQFYKIKRIPDVRDEILVPVELERA